jgi:hypothetical protein
VFLGVTSLLLSVYSSIISLHTTHKSRANLLGQNVLKRFEYHVPHAHTVNIRACGAPGSTNIQPALRNNSSFFSTFNRMVRINMNHFLSLSNVYSVQLSSNRAIIPSGFKELSPHIPLQKRI